MEGKPILATRWDGYTTSLGLGLVQCNLKLHSILDIAKAHSITAVASELRVHLGNYGHRKNPISDIADYGDSPEFQYDIRDGKVYVRELKGCYPQSLDTAGEFELLTSKDISRQMIDQAIHLSRFAP